MHNHVHPHEVSIKGSSLIHFILIVHLDEHHVAPIHCDAHIGCIETLCHIHSAMHNIKLVKADVTCMECLIHEVEGPTEDEAVKIGEQVSTIG